MSTCLHHMACTIEGFFVPLSAIWLARSPEERAGRLVSATVTVLPFFSHAAWMYSVRACASTWPTTSATLKVPLTRESATALQRLGAAQPSAFRMSAALALGWEMIW